MLEQSERDRLLRKLSPDQIDLDETYHSALRVRKGSTGQWLTSSPSLQAFLSTDVSNLFWLSGRRKWSPRNSIYCSATNITKPKLGAERPSSGQYLIPLF
jgi:hypothetical protein